MKKKDRSKSKSGSKVKLTENQKKGQVITGKARSTYMKVLKLEGKGKQDPTCSTGIMIPKEDTKTLKVIRAAIRHQAEKKFGADIDIFKSKKMKQPLKDGDELADDPETSYGKEVRGYYLLSTKAYKLPGLVNRHNEKILDPDDRAEMCVSGFWFFFSIAFRAFDVTTEEGGKSRGVRVLLNNLMFIKEGDRLDGGKSAEEDFEDFALDDDEDDEWEDDD